MTYMNDSRRGRRSRALRAWMVVLLSWWTGCWVMQDQVEAGTTAAAGSRPHGSGLIIFPDDIVLVDDTVVEGTVVRRLLDNVVVRRDDGVEELIPVRLVRHVRRVGEVEPVTLAEVLGEPEPDGAAGRQHPAEVRDKATASLLLVDAAAVDGDAAAAIGRCWTQARLEKADAVVVAVNGSELALEVVEAIGQRMGSLPAATHRVLVLGATSHLSLALAVHADEVWWVEGEIVRFQSLDPRERSRLETLMEDCIPAAVQLAMASDGTVGVDSAGGWVVDPRSGGVTAIDVDLARRVGLARRVIRRCDATEIEGGLDADLDWKVDSTSLARQMQLAARDEEVTRRQVSVAEDLIRAVSADAAEIRAAAKAFDDLYVPRSRNPRTGLDIRRIWLQESTWGSVDKKNRSLDAQSRVKKAIQSLESHCRRLQGIAGRLSKDDPEGRRIFDCWRRIQDVVDGLVLYKRSIERNQPDTYEAERAMVMRVDVPDC